ncbi:N-acetylmuramoyl-L-alanine amidase [Streptomyces sp. NA04227]|uniref:N-acetylmuramoyl-L-alanine amidase n=1 Tax=Streptomyces sp. NA04227 TaxID=2742136 RepID=UPI001591881F|nr:peptidoglycan recognition family protein [Streptomyces sp. NA04227]QKW05135.1 N-acetylmuramoyl-L-alanine amidase [Streptomyces sp. NA04227]
MRGSARERVTETRGRTRAAAGAVAAAALLLPLISSAPSGAEETPASGRLQEAFATAAADYDVPRSVLLGVSYLQSRWDSHNGAASVTGGYGPMHLTDARTALEHAPHHSEGDEDPRGDASRGRLKPTAEPATAPGKLPPRLTTLTRAAELTGLAPEKLRTDPAANIRGGAALLAAEQKRLGKTLSADPADWYAAIGRFSGAEDSATAATYAGDVFAVIRDGRRRTNDTGQRLRLNPVPGLRVSAEEAGRMGLRRAKAAGTECPATVSCEWIPAPYEEFGEGDYGNHDLADRPKDQNIEYIVVHDTEGPWDTTLKLVQDPTYVSWHYTLRSTDGHIAQHVRTKDVGWHAGNWFVNAKSVGLEHEGFLASPDAWYTEAMYRTSARLVGYLARKYDIPLNRQHILGHDTVPGTTTSSIPGMHTDPGPYWNWQHYFELLGAPLPTSGSKAGGVVTIAPDYESHQPVFTGCTKPSETCDPHGSSAVRLHTEPREDAPLIKDIGLRPGGGESTTGVHDLGSRVSAGQRYAVAERRGDWTAIWYLGQKAWFENPAGQPTAHAAGGTVITPKAGRADIPVYGRAYPEKEAYPQGVPVQTVSPLPYKLLAGQRYAVGDKLRGEYFYAPTFDTKPHRVVRGDDVYYEIQFGHRIAFVRAADVDVKSSRK